MAIILGLMTFIGWGSGDVFTIISSRKVGANLTTFWVFFCSFLFSLLFIPFVPHDFALITLPLLFFNIFLGILYIAGNLLIAEAFRFSSAPLVGIIIQSFPAAVLVLSTLVFKDVITLTQIIFIIITFIGVTLCSVDIKSLLNSQKIIDKGTILALVAMVFLSIYFTFTRVLINQYGWFLPNFISTACFPIILLFFKKRKEKLVVPKGAMTLLAIFMASILIRAGDFALNYGLSIPGAGTIVASLSGAAPVLFITLSYLIFKDKITKQQLIGMAIALTGILLLTFVH